MQHCNATMTITTRRGRASLVKRKARTGPLLDLQRNGLLMPRYEVGDAKMINRKLPIITTLGALIVAASAADCAWAQSYSTLFDGTENPLSENGVWTHTGADWTKVQKANGIAFGTQTGSGGYDDSYAVLSGFGPNQRASARVHISPSLDPSCTHEVEILLRWSDSLHQAKGYEVNLLWDGGYAQIVRWNGALGDFTVLGGGSYPGLKDGDLFEASIDGDLIKVLVNGQPVAETRDATFATGNPGIGFFRRDCGTTADVGFKDFAATSGGTQPMPPGSLQGN